MALNAKQEKFCQEYLIDLNGAQAAIRAGYSKDTARTIANKLLTKVDIQNYIAELQKGIRQRNKISQDEVLADLITIKNRCMQNAPVMYFDKVDKEWKYEGADIGEPIYKFDSNGAVKAIDLIAKHVGFYKIDNRQKQGINIIVADEKHKKMLEEL